MLLGRPLKGKWPLSHVIGLLAGELSVVVVVEAAVVVMDSWRRMSSSLLEMVLALLSTCCSCSPVYSCIVCHWFSWISPVMPRMYSTLVSILVHGFATLSHPKKYPFTEPRYICILVCIFVSNFKPLPFLLCCERIICLNSYNRICWVLVSNNMQN